MPDDDGLPIRYDDGDGVLPPLPASSYPPGATPLEVELDPGVRVVDRPTRLTPFRRALLAITMLILATAILLMLTAPAGTPPAPPAPNTTTTVELTCDDHGGCLIPPLYIEREPTDG